MKVKEKDKTKTRSRRTVTNETLDLDSRSALYVLLIPVVVLAAGGDGGFNGVVSSIESRYHVHATRIPFMGLVSLISRKAP